MANSENTGKKKTTEVSAWPPLTQAVCLDIVEKLKSENFLGGYTEQNHL